MYIRLIPYIFFIALSVLILSGCSGDSESDATGQQHTQKSEELRPPEEQAHITGTITQQDDSKILVEEDPNEPDVTLKSEVHLTDSTQYLIRKGDQYQKGKKEDLKKGMIVEVWYQGIVEDSDPVRANGDYIVYEQ